MPLPAASSKVRSFVRTFFVGTASFAATSLSAARSERRMYFSRAGSARSSSVNCRREEGRRLASDPRFTVSRSAFASFFTLRRSWASAARSARSTAEEVSPSPERSASASRPLMFVTSPVARFSATAPSRVIFCVTLSGAFSSFFMVHHPPSHRGRCPRTSRSRSWRCSGKWDTPWGGQTAFPRVFSRSARPSVSSVMRGTPTGSAAQRIRPSILSGIP